MLFGVGGLEKIGDVGFVRYLSKRFGGFGGIVGEVE